MESDSELDEKLLRIGTDYTASIRSLIPNPATVSGFGQQVALKVMLRLIANYDSILLLLRQGRHDETAPLIRRLLEDSLRLGMMNREPDKAEGRSLHLIITQCQRVIRTVDTVISDNGSLLTAKTEEELRDIAATRREDQQEAEDYAARERINLQKFPTTANMARILDRPGDILIYISATQATHSAFYGSLREYSVARAEHHEVAIESSNLHDRRRLINTALQLTAFAVHSATSYLGWESVAAGSLDQTRNSVADLAAIDIPD